MQHLVPSIYIYICYFFLDYRCFVVYAFTHLFLAMNIPNIPGMYFSLPPRMLYMLPTMVSL